MFIKNQVSSFNELTLITSDCATNTHISHLSVIMLYFYFDKKDYILTKNVTSIKKEEEAS